jgi:hypothetical protein
MMSKQTGRFVLVNLFNHGTFEFQFFPQRIETSRRANWQAQEVTTGTKPLFYFNRDPRRLVLNELWLDKSDKNISIKPEIDLLFALQDETRAGGTPPSLLALWGDRQELVVLEELSVEEQFFAQQGFPIRARVNMTLIEV